MVDRSIETLVVQWYHGEGSDSGYVWKPYSNIQVDIIEEAFQKKDTDVDLGDFKINLSTFCEINVDDETETRPVKRFFNSYREKSIRFHWSNGADLSKKNSSCHSFDAWCPFLKAWFATDSGKRAVANLSDCVAQCVEGILTEAQSLGRQIKIEGQFIASKIRQHMGASRQKISEVCIYFYTKDSFLYDILNRALRDEDHSKLATLAPYCYLMRNYGRFTKDFIGTVYRGIQLSEREIDEYEKAAGLWKTWTAYASTSKKQEVAEVFGNVLFIIEIGNIGIGAGRALDISSLSYFPEEEEVLLLAGTAFQVVRVERNSSEKIIIRAIS